MAVVHIILSVGYFGYVAVGGALFWVVGGGWGCMGHYFEWVGVGEGGWENILGGWRWLGVSGGGFTV